MDRKIVYPAQVPLSADFLQVQRNTLLALAYGVQAWGGTGAIADGLGCIPTVPASLSVQLTPGSLCQLSATDQSAFGSLSVDGTHQIMQQGILLDAATLTFVPPSVTGQAVNYLIQAQFQQSDTDAAVLAYFNSANPTVPYMGPANSGTAQTTTRKGIIAIQAKSGVAATAGSQVTPSPDAGWVGLYAVTVANNATALTSSQIAQLATAPFLSVKLPQVPAYVQAGSYAYAADTGSANAMSITLAPVPASYANMSIFVKKMGSANTGAMTANVNGLGNVAIINADGTPLASGQMAANFLAHLVFDGTSLRFMNGVASTTVGALTASSGEGVSVAGGGAVSLNLPGLTANANPGAGDLFGYYNQTDAHHRDLTFAQLITALFANSPGSLLRFSPFTVSGTWTKGANTKRIIAIGLAPGGGGASGYQVAGTYIAGGYGAGGAQSSGGYTAGSIYPAGGGGAGGGFCIIQDVTAISSLAITMGSPGGVAAQSNGGNGGSVSLGALASASGGFGGTLGGLGGAGGVGTLASGVIGFAWTGDYGAFGYGSLTGNGGSTLFGGGGGFSNNGSATTGQVGGFGSGGGGGFGANGGAGGTPLILIIEFS